MKNLNISVYGVEEMNQRELICVDGGFWWTLFQIGKIGTGIDPLGNIRNYGYYSCSALV